MQMIRPIAKIDTTNAMTVAFYVHKDTLKFPANASHWLDFPYRQSRYSKMNTVQDEIKDTIAR